MAIAIDTASSTKGANVTSVNWNHTTAAGTNMLAFIGVGTYSLEVSGVTYDTNACTEVWTDIMGAGYASNGFIYKAPGSGAKNIVVSAAGSCDFGAGCVTFTGVDQTTPVDTSNTANGYSATLSVVIASAIGDVVIDCGMQGRNAYTGPGADQTMQWDEVSIDYGSSAYASTEDGAANVTMSWDAGGSCNWIISGVSINPAAAGATLEQEGFRFRNDDGSEVAATWIDTQDTNVTQAKNTNTRFRMLLNAAGNPPANAYRIEVRKQGVGDYRKIN